MALTLQDFNKKDANMQQLRMDAFQPPKKPSPAANAETINTIASFGAALDPDGQIDEVYKSITNQLSYSTASSTLEQVVSKFQEHDSKAGLEMIRQIMIDPEVSDEQKTLILENYQQGKAQRSLAHEVGIAYSMEEDEGENGEQEDIRVKLAETYNDANQYNAWTQKTINALNSQTNPNWVTNVKSMVVSFIPFADAADQTFFENALTGLDDAGGVGNGVQTMLLLGEGRDRLRRTLINVPVEQRREVIQGMINVIRSTSGNLANDVTTLRAIENLERMVVPGAYGDNEKFWDNAFSVLDDTILLAPLSRIGRGVGDAIRGIGGAAEDLGRTARGLENVDEAGQAAARAARSEEILQIEYKPSAPDWTRDVDNIVDSLPIEPTSGDITQLRSAINDQMNNANFDIDAVVNNIRITDNLNHSQILDLRQQLGQIRDKRRAYNNAPVPPAQVTIDDVRARHVSSNVQPTSLAMVAKDTNISKARAAHKIVVQDETGQAARTLYGTTRENALAHDFLPEIGRDGRVANKVEYADVTPNDELIDRVLRSRSTSWADAAEEAAATKKVIESWRNVTGLKNRSAMSSVSSLKPGFDVQEGGVRINQVYGPENGGFSNAYTALDVVRAALNKYGVADSEITVLARQTDGEYAPVIAGTDLSNGDFLIQVNYDYRVSPKDVQFSGYDVSPFWGFMPGSRAFAKEGGLFQHIIPKSANIDPRAYVPGITAADKAAGLQKQFQRRAKDMQKAWDKLSKEQQLKVDSYIREANEYEIAFSASKIKGRGITDEGVEVLSIWKEMQDTLYVLENADLARTLRERGYELFEHRASDTRLIGTRVGRSNERVTGLTKVYDPAQDAMVAITRRELDELYEQGGGIMQLRQPIAFGADDIDLIINRNSPTSGFSRMIRDEDRILTYRNGYYHTRYTDPFYITKTDPKTGRTTTIGRAESSKDARIEMARLNETKDGFEYGYKADKNLEAFDNHLDVAINTGRTAQRVRGKRLERVGGASDKTLSSAGMESPIDSLTRAVASIAHRTSFRDVIDAEKRRWMSQFKHLAKEHRFPASIDDINDGPGSNQALHAFHHIDSIESGYVNSLDNYSKAFFMKMADVEKPNGWGWVDKLAVGAARVSPSMAGRLIAFKLMLASNPARQVLVQAAPALVVVSSLNPTGWARTLKRAGILGAWHAGVDLSVTNKIAKYGMKTDEMKDMLEAYTLSGMDAAVNAHVFMRDQMGRMADLTIAQKAGAVAMKPLDIAQKIGFDLGEQSLMSLIWLSEWDRMTRSLKRTKLTPNERDELGAKVRALTGDMNKGGDMPYNSNSLSVVMQFMQTPHKIAAGLIAGHRGLTTGERIKLASGYTIAFGMPVLPFITDYIDNIIPADKPEVRDALKGGAANILLNRMLTSLSGQETNVDFSGSIQPFTLEPMIEFVGGAMENNIMDILNDTAAVGLFVDNGRVHNFLKSSLAWLVPGEQLGVDESKQATQTFLQMFSGVSNYLKAEMIMKTGRIATSSGQTVDEDVSYMEALMKSAGFQTLDEVYYWAGNKAKWEIDGGIDSDIESLVDDYFLKLTREGEDVNSLEQYANILRAASETFTNSPAHLEKVKDYYTFKLRQNPDVLFQQLVNSGLYSQEDAIKIINNSRLSPSELDAALELFRIVGDSYGS